MDPNLFHDQTLNSSFSLPSNIAPLPEVMTPYFSQNSTHYQLSAENSPPIILQPLLQNRCFQELNPSWPASSFRALLSLDYSSIVAAESTSEIDPTLLDHFCIANGRLKPEIDSSPCCYLSTPDLQHRHKSYPSAIHNFSTSAASQWHAVEQSFFTKSTSNNLISFQPGLIQSNQRSILQSPIGPINNESSGVIPALFSSVPNSIQASRYPHPSPVQFKKEHDNFHHVTESANQREFECNKCHAKFYNAQAYGGHMSYHAKQKRTEEHLHSDAMPRLKKTRQQLNSSDIFGKNESNIAGTSKYMHNGEGEELANGSEAKDQ